MIDLCIEFIVPSYKQGYMEYVTLVLYILAVYLIDINYM